MLRRVKAVAEAETLSAAPEPEAEAIPGLEAAERAVREAQRRIDGIELEIQDIEAEGKRAEIALQRIQRRFDNGGVPQQSDIDDEAAAEAVIASIGRRVALLEGSKRRAEEEKEAAEKQERKVLRDEAQRVAQRLRAASAAEREAGDKALVRAGTLGTRAAEADSAGKDQKLTSADLRTILARTPEFASTAPGKARA